MGRNRSDAETASESAFDFLRDAEEQSQENGLLETEPGIDEVSATCPWCFEPQQLELDPSGGSHQVYVEDCWVCCRPCVISVRYGSGGEVSVEVERE